MKRVIKVHDNMKSQLDKETKLSSLVDKVNWYYENRVVYHVAYLADNNNEWAYITYDFVENKKNGKWG